MKELEHGPIVNQPSGSFEMHRVLELRQRLNDRTMAGGKCRKMVTRYMFIMEKSVSRTQV
jgi:hypothetical protein